MATLLNVNLLSVAYKGLGINVSSVQHENGEEWFIRHFLPGLIITKEPVLFDVGANTGEYARLLSGTYPNANIHCFEPNVHTFIELQKNSAGSNITCNNLGLANVTGESTIYFYKNDNTTGHASLIPGVIQDIHGSTEFRSSQVKIMRLEDYVPEQNIEYIDFIKIDVEGYELEVLKGASRLLSEKRIGIIQFEFNEMNIISRCFLKDFYDLLTDYDFFRLKPNKLFPLGDYRTVYEVFKIQNIVCIPKWLECK